MSNILNNNFRKIDCRLINDISMDFMLSKDNIIPSGISNDCLATYLKFNQHGSVVSNYSWIKTTESNSILRNIGYTGVDNGFISYYRDRIGNDEFLELFMNSSFDLSTYSNHFFVTPVKGNTSMFTYPIEVNDEFTSLKGGFYQGFFKIDGDKYQTLPHLIKDEWNFNFNLRRQDYTTPSNILNNRHKNNRGIFFFIGTRAENKFWEMYKSNPEMNDFKYHDNNEYTNDYDMMNTSVNNHNYLEDEPRTDGRIDDYAQSCNCDSYFTDTFNPYDYDQNEKNEYFESNDYITVAQNCPSNNLPIDDEYIQEQMQLNDLKLEDSKGRILGETGYYEIETDNKFIFFNNTKDGFTTKTWKDSYKFILEGKKENKNINYFPYLNNTKNGYTIKNIDKLNKEYTYDYDVFKDIENNALALKINDDGSISYRYLSTNCEIIEETSLPNLINKNEWTNVHLKIVRKPTEKCERYYQQGLMQLYIYINGYLKLVSKELPELMLKPLNDTSERQEGVPYNISIGGGTQGLSERILLDYYNVTDYVLPIEKNFAGSFIGDIKNFAFIPCPIDFKTNYQLISKFYEK